MLRAMAVFLAAAFLLTGGAQVATAADRVMLASVGETIGGLNVVEVVQHDEYEWVNLALPDGQVLTVELTRTHPDHPGLCTANGHSLTPRWELLGMEVSVEDQPPAVVALCARMAARGDTLAEANLQASSPHDRTGEVRSRQRVAPTERSRPLRWLHAVLFALAAACLLAVLGPGRRAWGRLSWGERGELALVGAVAAGARLLLSPRAVFWGPNFGVGRLVEAWGLTPDHPLYGGGFAALMALPSHCFGWGPDTVFGTHLVVASLAPPLLWALVRAAMPTPRARTAALVAGLALALLPIHLKMSGTEIEHIDVLTLELLAVLCAEGFCRTRSGTLAMASALATGFVAHIRPEVAAFSLVPAAWVLARARNLHRAWFGIAAVFIAALVAQRVGTTLQNPSFNALQLGVYGEFGFWFRVLIPQFGAPGASSTTHTFMHLGLTPWVLPVFALAGFIHAPGRLGGLAVLWWTCTTLFILPKAWPLADAFRLQLPGHAPMLLLAGIGGAALAATVGSVAHRWLGRWGTAGLIALASLPFLLHIPRLSATQEEFQFLREVGPQIPADAVVLLDDWGPHYDDLAHWMSTAPPCGDRTCAQWTGMGPFLDHLSKASPDASPDASPPRFAWLGVTCNYRPPLTGSGSDGIAPSSCERLAAQCTLTPVHVTTVSDRTDVDVRLPEPTNTVGLYRVTACEPSAAEVSSGPSR